MAVPRKRGETGPYFKNGRVRSEQRFVMIPEEVLQSESYYAVPDYAVRVLIALAAQFRGWNNGNLSLTFSTAREFGISTEWKLRAGLVLLETVGLIERMRVGHIMNGKGVCNLFALGFRQVDPSDKYDRPLKVAVPARMEWCKWARPDDWKAEVDRVRRSAQGKRKKDARYTRGE
jgi:hypothetical protein